MKNPALAILWVIPVLFFAAAAAIGISSEVEYRNFDGESARKNMRAILGDYVEIPSSMQLEDDAWDKLLRERQRAFIVAGSGAGAALLPLTVTAVGRSQKNATRELGDMLLAATARPEDS